MKKNLNIKSMILKEITEEDYLFLVKTFVENRSLTIPKAYNMINESSLSLEEKELVKKVEKVLEKAVTGFNSFKGVNFNEDTYETTIKLDYDYVKYNRANDVEFAGGYLSSYIGVGYIGLNELNPKENGGRTV